MTWLDQVWHIAWKDVREEAWRLGAYLAITTFAGVAVFMKAFGYSDVVTFIVFLFGMILAAAVVQSDSPIASDSFWGSRPFRPTAMLGAKVLLAAIVILIPSIAQGVALTVSGTDGGDAALAILDSARMYGLWLLAAMAVAGLTRDVRSFIVVFAAIFVAMTLAMLIGSDVRDTLAPPTPQSASAQALNAAKPLVGSALWTSIAVCASVALLVLLYRRRDARRRIWIGAIAVVVTAVNAAVMSEPARAHAATATSAPIRVELLRSDRLGKDAQMSFGVVADSTTVVRRFILTVAKVTVRLKDGTAVTVPGTRNSTSLVTAGNPFGANLRWRLNVTPAVSGFCLPLSAEQRSAISKGFTGLELSGTVHILEPRTLGTLPIATNRSLMRDGTRLRILNATLAPDGLTVGAQATSLPRPESHLFMGRLGFAVRQYAFVNESRREAADPTKSDMRPTGESYLVLPTLPLATEVDFVELKAPPDLLNAAWFMGARLAVVEWREQASHDVHVPIAEAPTPPELRSRDSTTERWCNQLSRLEAVPRP